MKTVLKKNAGFSLVELMVVIAIIGVLATIAIPKYNVFIAKSRQSEAQSNLAAVYTFEQNYYTEYNGFDSSLKDIAFQAEGKLRYNVGFLSSHGCAPNYPLQTGTACDSTMYNTLLQCPSATKAGATLSACSTLKGANNSDPTVPADAFDTTSFSTFTSGAGSVIAGAVSDTWTIDDKKNLVNTHDGSAGT